ncbi:stage III sporulation protein AA [Anaerosolibacter carboniphilus]|uniref:Stage III sporulation protein AA n=1 Tax=Anaerosolibacter carboniphilus TaxID=1417629 RepID=A0A841KT70_9FIRM|nr:stage III sporulation protein AA [Anaerosolibacter carboniphilus]MBB6216617.1 stage III sporulation protein AA [Anaerosolibacter carboniphilus]
MDESGNINFLKKTSAEYFPRKEILDALPVHLRQLIQGLPSALWDSMEEIRLRTNQPLLVQSLNRDIFIYVNGETGTETSKAYVTSKADLEKTFQLVTDYSVYALEEDIKKGFITIRGGHRVGISGHTVMNGPAIKTIKDISGLNIRISRQKIGISDAYMEYITTSPNNFKNTLIISPPQCGKTTLLRDMIRNLSNGMIRKGFQGFKVGVVDERSEICGSYQGIPQNDVGIRTDILDACPKAEGIMMLIRSMSPQIIATDEIGKIEDVIAIEEALNAGVKVLTTVHGHSLEEVCRRPNLKPLMEQNIFERIIILSNHPRVGTVQSILDGRTRVSLLHPTGISRRCESIG